jgi:hypothetical protein
MRRLTGVRACRHKGIAIGSVPLETTRHRVPAVVAQVFQPHEGYSVAPTGAPQHQRAPATALPGRR